MAAAQTGDAATYRQLLEELVQFVREQVRRHSDDPAHCEALVMDAFRAIHLARHTYNPASDFDQWIHAVVRNSTENSLAGLGHEEGVSHGQPPRRWRWARRRGTG